MGIIGKNLVTRPRWPEATTLAGWHRPYNSSGTSWREMAAVAHASADPITGGAGNEVTATGSSFKGVIWTPVGKVPPGRVYLWAWWLHTAAGNVKLGLLPLDGAGNPIAGQYAWSTAEQAGMTGTVAVTAGTFQPGSVEFTLPDMTGVAWEDDYGDQTYLGDHAALDWAVVIRPTGNVNTVSVGGCRLDLPEAEAELLPGYLDGSMTATEDIEYSWTGEPFMSASEAAAVEAGPIVIVPPSATFSDDPAEYTLPDVENVAWWVDEQQAQPGTYAVEPTADGVTVSIVPAAAEGYVFEPPAETQTHTWTVAPDPEPDPNAGWEWPEEITAGGKLVARWLKWTSEDEQLQCSFFYDVARAYVWGYTRGKGFDDQMQPTMPLQRVIVSGAVRLAYNPESAIRWQVSSESETLTVFNGFNLAEQAILKRYRRVWA